MVEKVESIQLGNDFIVYLSENCTNYKIYCDLKQLTEDSVDISYVPGMFKNMFFFPTSIWRWHELLKILP